MDATEKKVLKSISENLKKSAETNWKNGSIEDWSDWAYKMRTTIKNSTALLDSLLEPEQPSQGTHG